MEETIRKLLDAAPDAIVIVNQQGAIVVANSQAETVFGYKHEELIGKPVEILVPHRMAGAHVAKRDSYMEHPRVRPMGAGLQLFGLRKDGSEFPADIKLSPWTTEEGDFVISIIRDVTERHRTEQILRDNEEILRKKAEDLKRSNEELEQFAYVASHDLQEPLRMVGSFTQLLAQRYRGKLDAEADQYISFAVDGSKRMQALIQDLLVFSRLGTRGKPFEETDCDQILDHVLGALRFSIEENKATVTHDPLPTVQGDPVQLAQLLQNLIGNALKFHGESAPHVHISAERIDGEWQFSVRDNGIGIDPRYFERIFVIFQRLHGRDKYQGTGIGLAVCKKIVQRHGGRIWVQSEAGKGTAFFFTIPDDKGDKRP